MCPGQDFSVESLEKLTRNVSQWVGDGWGISWWSAAIAILTSWCVFVVVSLFIPKLCWERDSLLGMCLGLELVNHQPPYEPRLFTQVEFAVKAGVFEYNMYVTLFLLQICNWETFTYQNKDIFQVRRESLGGPTSHEHFTWHCPDVLDLATQTGRSVHDSTDCVWSQVFYLHPLADSYLWRRSSNCSHSSWIANRMKMKPPASRAHISEASQNVPVLIHLKGWLLNLEWPCLVMVR